jgi:uncharacterized protein (TIGR00730 family)
MNPKKTPTEQPAKAAKRSKTDPRKQRRKHLDDRLRVLHERALVLERELQLLEDPRFYRTCIFGSARIKPDSPIYGQVTELARLLASHGIDILTGGGPGLMEAANLGAQQGKKEADNRIRSYGLSIQLDFEPVPNKHLDMKRHHMKFSSRLDDFMRLSHSIIVTPGGVGTLLELYFSWQLIQVKHLTPRPIVLLDKVFWAGLLDWMHAEPLSRNLLAKHDFDFLHLVDTPQEALKIIEAHHAEFVKERSRT